MNVKDTFAGKFSFLTGGSSGIGKALAVLLARAGGSVAIMARNEERLGQAKEEVAAVLGANAFIETVQADASDQEQVKGALEDLISQRGVPDFLFNCVGAAEPGFIQDYAIEQFERAMKQDYFGYVVPTMQLLPKFIERGSGHVVSISSVLGYLGIIGYGTYAPAKFAVIGFSEVLRHEMKPKGIHVSVACPPDTDTPGFKTENEHKPEECKMVSARGKVMQPEEVAQAIAEGVAKKQFLILPGSAKFIFNMKRLSPSLVYNSIDGDLKKAMKKLGKR
jgi:short-subunit dehydrogenase